MTFFTDQGRLNNLINNLPSQDFITPYTHTKYTHRHTDTIHIITCIQKCNTKYRGKHVENTVNTDKILNIRKNSVTTDTNLNMKRVVDLIIAALESGDELLGAVLDELPGHIEELLVQVFGE